jgi:hypothetical protein
MLVYGVLEMWHKPAEMFVAKTNPSAMVTLSDHLCEEIPSKGAHHVNFIAALKVYQSSCAAPFAARSFRT